ncbi:MAG: hypothetical protein JW893_08530 [Candidatus Omnitrophica bacterium]|nr:hypothetical protein [Candidatus Omnitrophota bacterium]
MKMNRYHLFLIPFLSFLLGWSLLSWGKPETFTEVEKLAQKIEDRTTGWIGLQADLTLHFLTSQTFRASCRGEMLYHRLDEKILLNCFNDEEKLLFSFKSEDTNFSLYVPAEDLVYQGTIFDLEDSPDIESHLKPRDLYRGLKLAFIPRDKSELVYQNGNMTILNVQGDYRGTPYLSRRLLINQTADVLEETYYDFEGNPTLDIRRSDFRSIEIPESGFDRKVVFPFRIELECLKKNHGEIEKTILYFEKITFRPWIEETAWNLTGSEKTQTKD